MIQDATELLGLRATHRADGQTWLSSNGRAVELVLVHAAENTTHTIGLEALTADAVRAASLRVAEAGCRVLSTSPQPRLHGRRRHLRDARGPV